MKRKEHFVTGVQEEMTMGFIKFNLTTGKILELNIKTFLISGLLLILLCVTPAIAGSEVQLTEMSGVQEDPAVYKNKVAYVDRGGKYSTIRVIDLETEDIIAIPNHQGDQGKPDIYGNKVVYEDKRNGAGDIYLYNLENGEETRITDNGQDPVSSQAKSYPRIYGKWIVYADYKNKNGGYDIYSYDIESAERKEVSAGEFSRYDPTIWENWVAFTDFSGAYGEMNVRVGGIGVVNLATGEKVSVAALPVYQADPEIYGTKVVWEDKRDGQSNSNIYLYDFETGEEKRITTNLNDQFDPDIYGSRVVYDDWRGNKENVYLYDLDREEEISISKNKNHRAHDPVIYGDVIVYEGWEGDNADIYAYFLNEDDVQLTPDTGSEKTKIIEKVNSDTESEDPKVIYLIPLVLGGIGVYLWKRI